jgi:hypothetical protein
MTKKQERPSANKRKAQMGETAVNFIKSDVGIITILTMLLFALVKSQGVAAAMTSVFS